MARVIVNVPYHDWEQFPSIWNLNGFYSVCQKYSKRLSYPPFLLIAPLTPKKSRVQERKDRERAPENAPKLKLTLKVLVSSTRQLCSVKDEAAEWAGDPEENFKLVDILSSPASLLPRSSVSFKV